MWVAPLVNGKWAASLFNRSPGNETIYLQWSMLLYPNGTGIDLSTPFSIRDVWEGADLGVYSEVYYAMVQPHATTLLILTPQ